MILFVSVYTKNILALETLFYVVIYTNIKKLKNLFL